MFPQAERWNSQYSSAHIAAAIMRLRQDSRKVCEIRAEVATQNDRGLCGYNPTKP